MGSSSELALRLCLATAARGGAETVLLSAAGADLDLPMYAPERPGRSAAASRLVDELRRADGLVVSTPAYHGGMSGLLKNALDYAEDLRDTDRPYLDGRAVGCIVCAAGWQATATTLVALRSVVHALRGWPTPLGVLLNSREPLFRDDGTPIDLDIATKLETVARQVLDFTKLRTAYERAS